MKAKNSNSGQSLLEVTLSCLVFAFMVKAATLGSLYVAGYLWADFLLYEGLICAAAGEPPLECELNVLSKIKRFDRRHSSTCHIRSTVNSITGQLHWRILARWPIEIKNSIPREPSI